MDDTKRESYCVCKHYSILQDEIGKCGKIDGRACGAMSTEKGRGKGGGGRYIKMDGGLNLIPE